MRHLKSKNIVYAILIASVISLVACSNGEGDDLDQFMKNAANDMSKGVEPLPEVLPYTPMVYNADGALFDPFKPRKATNKTGAMQPNMNRPKEALEAFPLESLKYVGMLSKNKLTYALIKTPENGVQRVKVGNYMGPNFGLITAINEGEVEIKEIVQDDQTGDWVEHKTSLSLQE